MMLIQHVPWLKFVGFGVEIRLSDSGVLRIGNRCKAGAGTRAAVQDAAVTIGGSTLIGPSSTLVSLRLIAIGENALIAKNVSIRDLSHLIDAASHPMHCGFNSSQIAYGCMTWIGSKAPILKVVRLGEGTILGAHALVIDSILNRKIAVGIPAHIVRLRERELHG